MVPNHNNLNGLLFFSFSFNNWLRNWLRNMNIFYLNNVPKECVKQYLDKHVIKMILESTQILSTVYRIKLGTKSLSIGKRKIIQWSLLNDEDTIIYKATHIDHPCTQWTMASHGNYQWLIQLTYAMNDEYKYRYQKTTDHKSIALLPILSKLSSEHFERIDFFEPPSCMPDECIISNNPIINYRNYYKINKSKIASWKNRDAPEWF